MKIHVILVLYLVYLSHNEADARTLTTNHNQAILNPTLSTPPEPSFLQKAKQPTNRDILEIVGLGSDIAIGSDGTLWRISTEPEDGGRSIYRLDDATNTWVKIPGAGVRIAVDYDGTAWITNDKNAIFHYNGTGWEQVQGSGLDIAAGGNSVWHIDAKNAIWRLNEDGQSWEQMPGSAVRITADGDGNAWMVTKDHSIYRWTGSEWEKMPGQATDIGAGDGGTVYIAGTEKVAGGYQVWIWNEETHEWNLIYGIGATQVAVDSDGLLYAVKDDYTMFKLKNPDVRPRWKSVRREARDIGVGGDGTVWIVGTESKDDGYEIFRRDSDSNKWTQVEGAAATNIAVDTDGHAWIVDIKNQIMKYNGETWILLEGQGFDIGVGAENSVWHIGNNDEIFRLRTDKTAWNKVTGAKGERISVDEDGNAWVVTRDNKIYKYGAKWELIQGHAVDVACGADGTVVIAGNVSGKIGHQVSRWDKSTKTWIEIPGVTATRVAVGPTGDVYAINDSYETYSLKRFW